MNADNFYLSRFGFCPSQITASIPLDLKISVVIPCYAEENLFRTLACFIPENKLSFSTEVIVMINASETDLLENKNLNESNFSNGLNWASKNNTEQVSFHFVLNNELPKKHAGVGLARKIGMDEAVSRFHQIGFDGAIVCADADALYEKDFLQKVHDHFFVQFPKTPGCSIYFEHPLKGDEFDQRVYDGILRYELFLRYYKNALGYCGFPFSFHTIGSSMAVRSSAYQKSGGMNKRQAGEDFYFLQKIIELGNFTDMISTTVIPSPRPSHRVPFGTGRAVSEWLKREDMMWEVYPIEVFDELKKMRDQIPQLYLSDQDNSLNIHPLLESFLKQNRFDSKIKEIRKNASSLEFFLKRFDQWMDAFLVLKAAHFLRDEGMGVTNVDNACRDLLNRLKLDSTIGSQDLISVFRKLDRK